MTIQQRMFKEFSQKEIFGLAQQYGFEYLDTMRERNIFPTEEAINNLEQFVEALPSSPSNGIDVIKMLHLYGAPATLPMIGGRYFGFVNGGVVPAAMAAKCLSTFWDQNAAMYALSPIASRLESVVEKWLQQLLGLPEQTVAGYVSGTSSANLCGLAAGRWRILKNSGWDINEQGLNGAPKLRIVAGKEAHSTVIKAIAMLGLGKANIEWADTDEQGRIIPERMPAIDNSTILILQAGNVNSGSFDPFKSIMEKVKGTRAWVHIDGAFGLWAAAVEPLKQLTEGIEQAHSWAVDGHKTLNTPYDCGIVLCSDKEAITSALHMTGSYIVKSETERDGMYYTPEMSRRARIIELWAAIKYLGKQGIDEMIYGLHQRAAQFADEIKKIEGFEVLNEVVFNQVAVCCATDELTENVLKHIQELRTCWAGGASWQGKRIIRVSVCSWATTEEDISRSVESFKKALP